MHIAESKEILWMGKTAISRALLILSFTVSGFVLAEDQLLMKTGGWHAFVDSEAGCSNPMQVTISAGRRLNLKDPFSKKKQAKLSAFIEQMIDPLLEKCPSTKTANIVVNVREIDVYSGTISAEDNWQLRGELIDI